MPGNLRFFLYRDDEIVSQFLEQLEGGAYSEENLRGQARGGSSLGASIAAGPAAAHVARDRSSAHETELTLHQTGPSRYSRFHQRATESQDIQVLDAFDEAIWDQIATGEVIDVPVRIEVPAFFTSMAFASQASALMPFMQMLGSVNGEDGQPIVDPMELETVKRQLPVVQQTAAVTETAPIPIVAAAVGDPKFKFFVRLSREKIVVQTLPELDGEARMVAIIQSKVARGGSQEVGQLLPGLPSANRQQRRQKGTAGSDPSTIRLRYPAAVVTAIALFR